MSLTAKDSGILPLKGMDDLFQFVMEHKLVTLLAVVLVLFVMFQISKPK